MLLKSDSSTERQRNKEHITFGKQGTVGLTRKQLLMLAVLISGSFLVILNQTLVTPALPSIMADMGVDASTVQWGRAIKRAVPAPCALCRSSLDL